ncbi:DUF2254 domain-containing protein [Actinotalea sp. M2MS4P-6]|uniref:DUF2254 domain-containing protein n=1 Tax=Actinotalea sp. M2MS4P-6 TaxID=2983762 RepID=UPI0021E4496A|nr:DUF2254 domain-containing protein [Actinotalea sp. M2MS4P-6]MCV2393112.1 DUF2254 domain-containing protein [Actinotalea sp. M2MS4P-6]
MRRRESVREYLGAALWVLPFLAGNVALLVGFTVASIEPAPGSWLEAFAFRGSSVQARELLVAITGTVVTVIALVLGLSVVALQLTSTQFSPRLLRNFLRDRPNQVVLSVFMATFAYSAAGLFTVGVGADTETFPRLAVSGAIALLFVSMAAVVYFADHLSHSIQVDAIMQRVQGDALRVARRLPDEIADDVPAPAPWAVPVPARLSGYVDTAHPELLLPVAVEHRVSITLTRRVGEHVVAGTPLALVWTPYEDDPPPDAHAIERALDQAVGIGFERTRQQDVAIGIRQLVDVASKALSPAVNDPYTAVQAVDHLAVIFATLAVRPLGPQVGRSGGVVVVVPSRRFGEYLATMCGLVRRAGGREPTVMAALLRLLETCAYAARDDAQRLDDIEAQVRLVVVSAEQATADEGDVAPVQAAAGLILEAIEAYRPRG